LDLAWFLTATGIIAIALTTCLVRKTFVRDRGTPDSEDVGIRSFWSSVALFRRQYIIIGIVVLLSAVVVGVLAWSFGYAELMTGISPAGLGWRTGVAFLAGAASFIFSGYLGTVISLRSGIRNLVSRRMKSSTLASTSDGGIVSGLLVLALCLIGFTVIYFTSADLEYLNPFSFYIVSFTFGISLAGLLFELSERSLNRVQTAKYDEPEGVLPDCTNSSNKGCGSREIGPDKGRFILEFCAAASVGAILIGLFIYRDYYVSPIVREVWLLFPFALLCCIAFAVAVAFKLTGRKHEENPISSIYKRCVVASGMYLIGLILVVLFALGTDFVWFIGAGAAGVAAGIVIVYMLGSYISYLPNAGFRALSGRSMGLIIVSAVMVTIGLFCLLANCMGYQATNGAYELGFVIECTHGGIIGISMAAIGIVLICPFVLLMGDLVSGTTMRRTIRALSKAIAMIPSAAAAPLIFQANLERGAMLREMDDVLYIFDIAHITVVEVISGALAAVAMLLLFRSITTRGLKKAIVKLALAIRRKSVSARGIADVTLTAFHEQQAALRAQFSTGKIIIAVMLVAVTPGILYLIFHHIPGYDAAMALRGFLLAATIGGVLLASFISVTSLSWTVLLSLILWKYIGL
jgi:hypothetical protein